ncbi:hypothetical protein PNOK_0744800 [Pyrrhoderma noxium]|uniref:Uncharacterized protein n=1 Tax=Pyrrhoderma noxium TaxID=2282107 RepID=A0A286UCY1_9AGAM|nr:hypothetical protein PNOK_0744800 [Pyrrhoderma noxium]
MNSVTQLASSSNPTSSSRSTPVARSTASPSPVGVSTPSSIKSSSSSTPSLKQKPGNVFSDDGSFLERFQRDKKEEDEKKLQDEKYEKLARKLEFENRFKKRGKRRAPSPNPSPSETPDDFPAKKLKVEEQQKKPLTAYEKEMKSYRSSLKDTGTGVRPLVK